MKLHAWYEESITPLKNKRYSNFSKELDDIGDFSDHESAKFSDEDETINENSKDDSIDDEVSLIIILDADKQGFLRSQILFDFELQKCVHKIFTSGC